MAPHSSTLAWKIPWMEEPGRLQSMGLLRVRHDRATSLSLFTFMHWRKKWQPTPVFLPGESQGQGSLVSCRLWGRTESDATEATQQQQCKVQRPLLCSANNLNKFNNINCKTLYLTLEASLVAQMVKKLPSMRDTWVGKIPWQREWQPTPVFSAWKIPRTEKFGRLQSMGSQRVRHD